MYSSNVYQQGFVTDAFVGVWLAGFTRIFAMPVLKVAAGADAQDGAADCDWPQAFVAGYPRVLHRVSRAKYAVAFFKMSRSILTRDSSARSRANSICSAVTGLSPAPRSCPFLLSRTQLPKLWDGMPNILAVVGTLWPPSTSPYRLQFVGQCVQASCVCHFINLLVFAHFVSPLAEFTLQLWSTVLGERSVAEF